MTQETRTVAFALIGALACIGVGIGVVYAVDLPTNLYIAICGDNIVQTGEVCDDGTVNNVGTYASSTASRTCVAGCQAFGPYCGDGILQARFSEECDDGNNTSGDLCSSSCKAEVPVQSTIPGSPTRGSTPSLSAPPGTVLSELQTKVVVRGKSSPGARVTVLLDGQKLATVQADANADFLYNAANVTPGTATFGFTSLDLDGVQSFMSSVTFDVIQSAVTTVSNIFIPPTISTSADRVAPGGLLTLSGRSVPGAQIVTQVTDSTNATLSAVADATGAWALRLDTGSFALGTHAAKSYFQLSTTTKSGFGRAVSFSIGTGTGNVGAGNADLNGDGKVNLIDFSIMLTQWKHTGNADLNDDGSVGLADFSILLFHWTG